MELSFLGGVGTVTGSKYLVETGERRILVDCGLFQGFKNLRLRNWSPLPVLPDDIDEVVLTHAHLDHSGYLPLMVRDGYEGRVHCSKATADLCGVLLPDSGHLQEQDAEFANRHGFSKHHPALPLYTREDADRSLDRFAPLGFGRDRRLGDDTVARLHRAGHILGASIVELRVGKRTLIFSGDLGRPNDPVMMAPANITSADYLIVESTYGDRRHDRADPQDALAGIIQRTAARGGTLLVPAFAVGRAQSLLYLIRELKSAQRIPDLPVFLDSPMAIDASELYCRHHDDHRLNEQQCRRACSVAKYLRSADESKSLNINHVPSIIISASGMLTGGRVLHHLKRLAPDRRNTILITGYQAGGTRGAALLAGAESVKVHGARIPVQAEVCSLATLSAHADADEILDWLRSFHRPPVTTFVTHGEPVAADALRQRIEEELGWSCVVPDYRDSVSLG
ncbi:MAG: MBL fold metallo-hydrolase [Alphaproteobacteria bacterium]